ncbi:MAG: hypothetical protein ACI9EF_000513 [Pseudohongiellaceae bacterium]|jgi:hypothetical protein
MTFRPDRALFWFLAACALCTACDSGGRPAVVEDPLADPDPLLHDPEPRLLHEPAPLLHDPVPLLLDVAAAVGLNFVHFNGMTGDFHFPEMTGSGAALFDYDNDGDLDAYMTQGAPLLGGGDAGQAPLPLPSGQPSGDRLFRNALIGKGSRGELAFEDVTEASGLSCQSYGMGVATGDVDGDGYVDVFVANLGPNQLLGNGGDGTFSDSSPNLGDASSRWSVAGSFCDLDLDGDLDLYLVNYVTFDLAANPRCYATSSRRDYCGPSAFDAQADVFLRNRGDGSFDDHTLSAFGVHPPGPGLGVATCDVNGDGWLDVFVANDGAANALWLNQGDGSFREDSLFAGVALNSQGQEEASMGVDVADFDGDGDEDLFVAHLAGETNTLYVNDGSGLFEDRTTAWGLGADSLSVTSFGATWLDVNGDGWLDMLTVGGAVRLQEEQVLAGSLHPLGQRKQLFLNHKGERFEMARPQEAEALARVDVGRGSAVGDVDNDGDADVLVANNGGRAQLLLSGALLNERWLGLRCVAGSPSTDVLGARVALHLSDGSVQWRRAHTDGSFASARDPRVLFAVGASRDVTAIMVDWPGDGEEWWENLAYGQYTTLAKGSGSSERPTVMQVDR